MSPSGYATAAYDDGCRMLTDEYSVRRLPLGRLARPPLIGDTCQCNNSCPLVLQLYERNKLKLKLKHVLDGGPSSGLYTISVCNKPTKSTQPCIPPGSLNRVPASAGVRAVMSPLPGGR